MLRIPVLLSEAYSTHDVYIWGYNPVKDDRSDFTRGCISRGGGYRLGREEDDGVRELGRVGVGRRDGGEVAPLPV